MFASATGPVEPVVEGKVADAKGEEKTDAKPFEVVSRIAQVEAVAATGTESKLEELKAEESKPQEARTDELSTEKIEQPVAVVSSVPASVEIEEHEKLGGDNFGRSGDEF
jgi:hypothetical protein